MKNSIQVSISTNELNENTLEAMWQVYRGYYNYSYEYFMNRIDTNNYFSFYTIDGRIIGFTGLRINRTEVKGRQCLLIYFGQTVIDKAYRGNSLIPRTACKLLLHYWKDLLLGRLYVWADTLTYKAYMVFAKNLSEYYPSYQSKTPNHVQELLHFVGKEYYEENYCTATGTIKKEKLLVNDASMMIDQQKERDLDALFYASANPKYIEGHGLLTVAPMHIKNYLTVIYKCLKKKIFGGKRKEICPLQLQTN